MAIDTRVAAQLAQLIDTLKRQHRAGINPHYGQLDDLFDLGAQLGASVAEAVDAPVVRCASTDCPLPAAEDVAGRRYCLAHARQAITTLTLVKQLMPDAMPALGRVAWPTGRS